MSATQPRSPRWVALPSLAGALGVLVLLVLHLLPDGADPWLAWLMVLVPLTAMGVLARSWRRRLPVTAYELEWVRVGIVVLSIAGLAGISGGAIPLTVPAGVVLGVWTVREHRRSSPSR
ncbi:hypothetical protein HMPREF0063_12317 [Aeromicrobium marinum DSM 15272]|uniref:Uncharacterized protein n=1 Tax=Aeromicrobium marinum DSM 15272 TaxID=585531 RepID=E2SD05_9ACTN|nr:hypothetical protein [Aeromicrobium marinum]EFQ83108.1 hypothetical protein HMPREF0063_12317 [Aeromicrobium marinum DSM 15272]